MCKYCDYNSDECCIFVDTLDGNYYYDYQTSEWDDYEDGYIHDKIYISYCPWCGRDLENKVDFLKDKTPVFRFTTEYTVKDVSRIYKHLLEKYPNLLIFPQDFDIDWMTREDFEDWVERARRVYEEPPKSKCNCNGIRDKCNLSPKYQCEDD